MDKHAVIDLGTNTFNLLIAETAGGRIQKTLFAEEIPVKLGEGGINQGYITERAFDRGIHTLRRINSIIRRYEPDKVTAIATSAIRSASNGVSFIERVLEETGINIQTIDGEREAELIYKGVRAAVNLQEPALIMDIGGGSVEFILCDEKEMFWKKSFPIGAARLRERFHQTEPISPALLGELEEFLGLALTELLEQTEKYHPAQLIGSAGAFETFAEMLKQPSVDEVKYPEVSVSFDFRQLIALLHHIIGADRQEREQMPGLVPFRVDMIVVASALTRYVLERAKINSVQLSTFALKEGILVDLMEQE